MIYTVERYVFISPECRAAQWSCLHITAAKKKGGGNFLEEAHL